MPSSSGCWETNGRRLYLVAVVIAVLLWLVVCVLASVGAGKSTVMYLLVGLESPFDRIDDVKELMAEHFG